MPSTKSTRVKPTSKDEQENEMTEIPGLACRCCTNANKPCLIPCPFTIAPIFGFKLPACIRCVIHGHDCSNLENVPTDHRWWYDNDSKKWWHRGQTREMKKEEDELCKAGHRAIRHHHHHEDEEDDDEEDDLHDHALEESKWEPHFHTLQFALKRRDLLGEIHESEWSKEERRWKKCPYKMEDSDDEDHGDGKGGDVGKSKKKRKNKKKKSKKGKMGKDQMDGEPENMENGPVRKE
ncbi:hypothetical protein CI109_107277 [Kwoniella shandongensis]|uniref:Uncharacterized protein n=1 Tax=Kwoniella shandongensis TaxID=1734106 RepID=A0A5M6C7P0_9TREE|nr:uncharacterized protein CI109_002560 [Kwoniella shandongensis]KAA5529219.1 hypothetical protein CI109_002560 [Kwoniella shandongensis]